MMTNSILLVEQTVNSNVNEGLAILVVGWFVVILTLVILAIIFTVFSKILKSNIQQRFRKRGKTIEHADRIFNTSGEVNAAIATAVFLYFEEQHDEESGVITIKRVSRNYSPWSSKLYGLQQYTK